jgi:hypothetical protein
LGNMSCGWLGPEGGERMVWCEGAGPVGRVRRILENFDW